jgi:glutamyl-tRNA reductase
VEDLRERFRKHREDLLRERLAEMKDLTPEEHARLSSITEELIERMLDEPAERLRNAREMRGRLGAIDALRHLFGIDRDADKGPK